MFDAEKTTKDIIKWIRNWFDANGKGCKAVVGVSGGKDSSVVAALCTEALGKENVIGVMMPRGEQFDIDVSEALIRHLGIRGITVNVDDACNAIEEQVKAQFGDISPQTKTNIPPRIRMTMLYAVCQTVGGRVANTCNLSEDYVGYNTIFGDNAGDFSPLSRLTVQEVKAVGRTLGLPPRFVDKVPIDGLQGKTDEDNLGFSYEVLDKYIRTGVCDDVDAKAAIDMKHRRNLFKLRPMPAFEYGGEVHE